MIDQDSVDEGWRQIRAGHALLTWSKLVHWDRHRNAFRPAAEDDFESADGHRTVHPEYGRLISWLVFSTGAEYLAKGVCMVNGLKVTLEKKAGHVKIPYRGEDLGVWVAGVLRQDKSFREDGLISFTLGTLPLAQVLQPGPDRDLALAAFKLLASSIGNRDSHRYTESVRAFHFHVVPSLLVPGLNAILRCVDQSRLGRLSSRHRHPA